MKNNVETIPAYMAFCKEVINKSNGKNIIIYSGDKNKLQVFLDHAKIEKFSCLEKEKKNIFNSTFENKEKIILCHYEKIQKNPVLKNKVFDWLKSHKNIMVILVIKSYNPLVDCFTTPLTSFYHKSIKINLDTLSPVSNHLICADFRYFDFSDLYQVFHVSKNAKKDKHGILWYNAKVSATYFKDGNVLRNANNQIVRIYNQGDFVKVLNYATQQKLILDNENRVLGSNDKKITIKDGTVSMDHKFNVGDFVYVYYKNLPDKQSRILIRCKVVHNGTFDSNYQMSSCWYTDSIFSEQDRIPAICLDIDSGINYDSHKHVFSYETINKKIHFQGKTYLYHDKNGLLQELEEACKKCPGKEKIVSTFKEYFAYECVFEKEKWLGCHTTFQTPNRLNYYENHHLIEQCKGREELSHLTKEDLEKIINHPFNQFNLCSSCHNRIHYGLKEERKKMISLLYHKNKSWFDEQIHTLEPIPAGEELAWLYHLYGADNQQ